MADTNIEPELEEPPGHALSTRGYVIVAAIPPLIAVLGILGLWWHYSPNDVLDGKLVPTVNSPWHPGQPGGRTVISGTLQLDNAGCAQLSTGSGGQLVPVWPAGYVVTRTPDGRANLYDTGRHLVAHDGDQLRATGQIAPVAGYAGRPCAPSSGDVAIIESAVVVTQQ